MKFKLILISLFLIILFTITVNATALNESHNKTMSSSGEKTAKRCIRIRMNENRYLEGLSRHPSASYTLTAYLYDHSGTVQMENASKNNDGYYAFDGTSALEKGEEYVLCGDNNGSTYTTIYTGLNAGYVNSTNIYFIEGGQINSGVYRNSTRYFQFKTVTTSPYDPSLEVTILHPINDTTYTSTSVDLNWTVNEAVDWCAYNLDSGSNISLGSPPTNTTLTSLSDGTHNLTVYCNDTSGNIEEEEVDFSIDLSIPPILSDVICTSCTSGTNQTVDSTPTINVTCIDVTGCSGVRISNNSAYNYSNATSLRNCTVGSGNTWVCTLISNDAFSQIGYAQSIYFWANDTNGDYHSEYNISINITYVDGISPSYSNIEHNASPGYPFDSVQFNVTFSDNYQLGEYIFSWNDSSSWVNDSPVDMKNVTSYKAIINKSITADPFEYVGFRWYFNDSNGNTNLTSITSFTVFMVSPHLYLDGLDEDRTYEYETTANISLNGSGHIDILDGTGRYRGLPNKVNYTIDTIRLFRFNDTTESKNLSSGETGKITIDNRTELYSAKINMTGFNSPMNITLNYSNYLRFAGILLEHNLYQDKYIYENILYVNTNLSYLTSGSKTIYINFSNQGNFSREGYFNFTLTAFDLDAGNDFDYTENFSKTTYLNLSSLKNTSAPLFTYDDFETADTEGKYTLTDNCGDGSGSVSTGITGGYYEVKSSAGSNQKEYCGVNLVNMPIDNLTRINLTANLGFNYDPGYPRGASYTRYIKITDGTDSVDLYSDFASFGVGAGSNNDIWVWEIKKTGNTWRVYKNGSDVGSANIGSLSSPIYLRFGQSIEADTGGNSLSAWWYLQDIKHSGIGLTRTEGEYETNVIDGTFESLMLTEGTNNIARIYLTADVFTDENTSIGYYASNDNGTTYESITLDNFHTFSSTGQQLKVKFVLNSTSNQSSPIIKQYRAQIIPSAPTGLFIDIGDDDINEIHLDYELNMTTTPWDYTGNDSAFNEYINRTGDSVIPIEFILESGGILQISNLNITQDINPIELNISPLQDLNSIPITPIYTGGTLQFDSLGFDFRGSYNITVVGYSGDYSNSENHTITVRYSSFNVTYPSGEPYWQIFPTARNQSGIEPFGQNSSHGIWRIDSNAYDSDMNVYTKYNESIDSCVTQIEFRGQNFSASSLNNQSTLNVTNLTTSSQKLVENLNDTTYGNIRSYTMINCSESPDKYFIPYFCFFSICTECVKTQDWESNCEWIE